MGRGAWRGRGEGLLTSDGFPSSKNFKQMVAYGPPNRSHLVGLYWALRSAVTPHVHFGIYCKRLLCIKIPQAPTGIVLLSVLRINLIYRIKERQASQ